MCHYLMSIAMGVVLYGDSACFLPWHPSQSLCVSPEDPLCLVPVETQNLLGQTSLHPGQLPVWIAFILQRHDFF